MTYHCGGVWGSRDTLNHQGDHASPPHFVPFLPWLLLFLILPWFSCPFHSQALVVYLLCYVLWVVHFVLLQRQNLHWFKEKLLGIVLHTTMQSDTMCESIFACFLSAWAFDSKPHLLSERIKIAVFKNTWLLFQYSYSAIGLSSVESGRHIQNTDTSYHKGMAWIFQIVAQCLSITVC